MSKSATQLCTYFMSSMSDVAFQNLICSKSKPLPMVGRSFAAIAAACTTNSLRCLTLKKWETQMLLLKPLAEVLDKITFSGCKLDMTSVQKPIKPICYEFVRCEAFIKNQMPYSVPHQISQSRSGIIYNYEQCDRSIVSLNFEASEIQLVITKKDSWGLLLKSQTIDFSIMIANRFQLSSLHTLSIEKLKINDEVIQTLLIHASFCQRMRIIGCTFESCTHYPSFHRIYFGYEIDGQRLFVKSNCEFCIKGLGILFEGLSIRSATICVGEKNAIDAVCVLLERAASSGQLHRLVVKFSEHHFDMTEIMRAIDSVCSLLERILVLEQYTASSGQLHRLVVRFSEPLSDMAEIKDRFERWPFLILKNEDFTKNIIKFSVKINIGESFKNVPEEQLSSDDCKESCESNSLDASTIYSIAHSSASTIYSNPNVKRCFCCIIV